MPPKRLLSAAARPFKALFVSDARAGVLLIAVALLAVYVANSPWAEAYHELFHAERGWSPVATLDTAHAWINDGLMAVFFFVVGLEVKRELIAGNLADAAVRRLPVLAALAGMIAPALVYLAMSGANPALVRGWAIPAATDIAFAMGVIGLVGSRVPGPLRMFLLTVAIIDDIGAVLVIALFYTTGIEPLWLLAAGTVLMAMAGLNMAGVERGWPYVAGAGLLWLCVLQSGIHPTVAGVAAALTIPLRGERGLLEKMEHKLVGWNAYLIVPLFGFANAGVSMSGLGMNALFAPLPLAVGAGLVLGKQLGIFGSVFAAERLGFAPRPAGTTWLQVWGAALLCGIGFTMSLFIGALAFPEQPNLVDDAKLGVLAGSLIAALCGFGVLRLARGPTELA
jgi:NhaA family Na+:H+ antiporter